MAKGKPRARLTTETKPFAWQGVRMDIPVDWDVGLLEGRQEKGFVRIDDPEMPRLELRWLYGSARFDIDMSLDRYFKTLRKTAEKAGGEIDIKPRGGVGPDRRGLISRGFRWQTDQEAIGCIVFNPDTRCIMIAQGLVAAGAYGDEAAVRRTMASLGDGADADGKRLWAIYDFMCRILADCRLVQHSLKTGAFQLTFEGRYGQVAIHRWALAEHLLAKHDNDIVEWWRSGLKRADKRLRDEVLDTTIAGHAGKQVVRRKPNWISLLRPQSVFLWHCPDSNQLVRVDVTPTRKKHWDKLVEGGWEVLCHGPAPKR